MAGDEAPSCNNNDDSNNNNSADKSRARSAEDERRRWQLVDDSRDVKLQRNNQSRGQSSRHSQLGAARSLESAPPPSSEQVEPTAPAKGQLEPSKEEESKQMFSLKQLAINSRNLARRRPPGQEQPRGTFARLFRESGSQSSSQSSADSSNSVEAPNVRPRRASAPNNQASESPTCARCEGLAADTSDDELLGHQDEEEDDDEEVEDEEDDDEEDDERKLGGRRRRRRQVNRCCNCEQLVSRIDLDGLPVTDVDLVSYRDLCQMEQQARLASRQPAASMLLGRTCNVMRRRSLQEESGAYYQLCTSGQEQLIRQRYAWFPPSLKLMQLVEQFFQHFPAQKIPLQPEGAGEQPAYRDQQIAFQLPRQDISLDYCGYHMSEQSRLAYLQFVDKRNSQALDVGTVVQLRLQFGASNSQADAPAPVVELQHQRAQRKASTVSQAALALAVHHNNQKQQQQQPPQDQLLANGGHAGTQRCRRCLVRFEDTQLAIVAPNFVIGSTALYRPLDNQPADRQRRASNSSQPPSDKSLGPGQQQPTNAAMFHPTCFTCSTCKEFLVDMVYCLRDNKLYCLRHYGDSLRPRCHWCQELIFSDEYLKAMNESFHVDHFLCRHCDSNLAGQRYVLKDEKPFCIQCYEANFANTCEDCQKPIGIDSRDLSYQGRHWHDNCFLCNKCQQSLIDKPFSSKTDKVYCADCYDVTFAARCDGCNNPLRAGSKKMEYRGKQWHDTCFCCCVCQLAIGSNSFIPKNDDIYCIKCYEDKYATRCTKCKQVIVSGGVTFRNEPWHRDCFNCCNCNKSLAGQRFTTRDVSNETVMNTNKTNQPHNAYCIDCYGELFAKKCFACSQAITGLGGTRFVTFEDRSWHNDCFLCNDCNTSLVGKGFITDGPESILCGECARAKFR